MNTRMGWLLAALVVLSSCTGGGRLYNLTTGEVVALRYKYGASGHGSITGAFGSGESIAGEYTTLIDATASWGSVYGSVAAANVAASSSRVTWTDKQRGTAIMAGDRGSLLQCEYVVSESSGHGSGGCRGKDGTLYRLMF